MADNNNKERTKRDAAGVGPYAPRDGERLEPLGKLGGWGVAEGEPDIRGWEVRTVSGRELGKVKELWVDPDEREVVTLEIDLSGTDRRANVAIRLVQVDRAARIVRMDSADLIPAEDVPVPEAMTPGEVEVRAEGVAARRAAAAAAQDRHVRYPGGSNERIIEQRPMVEETVIRRREVSGAEASESLPVIPRRRETDPGSDVSEPPDDTF